MHGERNFPFRKEPSDLDIGLPDDTTDDAYLNALDQGLDELSSRFKPGFIIYLGGADIHEGDRLGRLKVSKQGVLKRDQKVFDFAKRQQIGVAVVMAGGYGHDIAQTVSVHAQTIATAAHYASTHHAK
jgi:acetoin utilization deacetylase AcuC-like enzyme